MKIDVMLENKVEKEVRNWLEDENVILCNGVNKNFFDWVDIYEEILINMKRVLFRWYFNRGSSKCKGYKV